MSDTYPDAPGFKAPGPSEDAATAITPIAGNLRDQVREVIASSPAGITADGVASRTRPINPVRSSARVGTAAARRDQAKRRPWHEQFRHDGLRLGDGAAAAA